MLDILARLLLIGISSIAGLFLVPIALPFAKDGKLPKWAWIWDNDRDGISGDGGFRNEHCPSYKLPYGSFICNYIWLAVRNPSANLCWKLGVNEVIESIEYTWYGSVATGFSGKKYYLVHFDFSSFYKTEMYIGFKNDNVIVGELVPYNIGIAFRGLFLILPIGGILWSLF